MEESLQSPHPYLPSHVLGLGDLVLVHEAPR